MVSYRTIFMWGPATQQLSQRGRHCIAPELLGTKLYIIMPPCSETCKHGIGPAALVKRKWDHYKRLSSPADAYNLNTIESEGKWRKGMNAVSKKCQSLLVNLVRVNL